MGDQATHDALSDPTTLARWLGWLKGCAPMRDVSRRVLSRVLWAGNLTPFTVGQALCTQGGAGDHASAFFFVLDGVVKVERDGVLVVELGRARTFGVEAVLQGLPFPATVTGVEAGTCLRFERADVLALLEESASLQQANGQPAAAGGADAARWEHLLRSAQVVRFESAIAALPIEAMVDFLAQTVVRDFPHDRVLVLYGADTAWAPQLAAGPPNWPGTDGVYRAAPDPRAGHDPLRFDYIFLVGEIPDYPGLELDMIVNITRGLPAEPPTPDVHRPVVLPTVLIDSAAAPVNTLTGRAVHEVGVHSREAAVWIKLELERLRQAWQPGAGVGVLGDEQREAMARWARAVTDRRVGIALSGGGAWGFYHVAVLRKLIAEKRVPIDVVTSASIGSAVAGYFCAHGLEGLDELVEFATARFLNLDLVAAIAIVTTAGIQYGINRQLHSVQLNQLSTRFHPVATDLTTASSYVIVGGNIGLAVRASASAPGVWGPTLLEVPTGPAHFVDGCVADNLPACVLPPLGADLTMAINCFPKTPRRDFPIRGPVWRFLASLDPLGRVRDLVSSGDLMLHASGDFEGQEADVLYCVESNRMALIGATQFKKAREIIAEANSTPLLCEKVDEMAKKWEALKLRERSRQDVRGTRLGPIQLPVDIRISAAAAGPAEVPARPQTMTDKGPA